MPQTDLLIQISKDLGENTAKTNSVLEQLKTLNGKVAGHETRLQSMEGANAITAATVAELKEVRKRGQDTRSLIYSRVFWGIAGGGMVIAGRIITYLIQNDFIKQIIK